ncbi:MAG: YbaN family protein [Candidatus Bathyarchaeota archaeon]|nr:YbaN family protein [Candidatus Bathyarchaeota archaeon]MDH5787219.1 YbaN family protein [Candidatus Bathyarchaeota archaeon]
MSQTCSIRRTSKFKKGIFVVAGTISLGLGVVGVFLPILPTTPFLLLSAACYYKGSERMHRWLLNNKWLGDYIRNYKEGKGISPMGKVFTLVLLWITICYSVFFMLNEYILQIVLFAIAIAVTLHVITLPTFRKS